MTIEERLKTSCIGCSSGWPQAKFVEPEGDRYVHMEGSKHAKAIS